jgi:hypothetical protein
MPPEEGHVHGDPNIAPQVFRDFFELYRGFIEQVGVITDKAMDVNKQVSSFHERLMLVDFGTIGISVSALISLTSKISTNPAARHTFAQYVAPAWVLLLASTMMCRNVMALTVGANRKMLEEWSQKVGSYNIVQAMRTLMKMSNTLSGVITVDSESRDVSAYFADEAKKVQVFLQEQAKIPVPSLSAIEQPGKWQSRLAVITMQIALILLGVAAIKLFLLA